MGRSAMMTIGFVFVVLQIAPTLSNTLSNNAIVVENMRSHCEDVCKAMEGTPEFYDDSLICTCHVGNFVDDDAISKQPRLAGLTMLILPKDAKQKREVAEAKIAENSTISAGAIKPKYSPKDTYPKKTKPTAPDNKVEQQPPKKLAEVDEPTIGQSMTSTTQKSTTSSDSAVVGAIGPTRRSTISPRRTGVLPRQSISVETTRSILEGAKKQLAALVERTRLVGFNPSLIGTEIEAIRTALAPLSSRHAERSGSVDRSKLIEQIRAREKERQARLHSRFGHLDAKKKHLGHVVGAAKPNEEIDVNEVKVITQPKELIEG